MKLSDVMKVWDTLHTHDCGELGFADLEQAIDAAVGVENDCASIPYIRHPLEGTWPEDDIRRAFVAGASWWEYHKTGFTMWQSDRNLAEDEAERRYPGGNIRPTPEPETAEQPEEQP